MLGGRRRLFAGSVDGFFTSAVDPICLSLAFAAVSEANWRINGLFFKLGMPAVSFCRSAISRSAAGLEEFDIGAASVTFPEGVPTADPGAELPPNPGFAGVLVTEVEVVGINSPNSFHSSTCSRSWSNTVG